MHIYNIIYYIIIYIQYLFYICGTQAIRIPSRQAIHPRHVDQDELLGRGVPSRVQSIAPS